MKLASFINVETVGPATSRLDGLEARALRTPTDTLEYGLFAALGKKLLQHTVAINVKEVYGSDWVWHYIEKTGESQPLVHPNLRNLRDDKYVLTLSEHCLLRRPFRPIERKLEVALAHFDSRLSLAAWIIDESDQTITRSLSDPVTNQWVSVLKGEEYLPSGFSRGQFYENIADRIALHELNPAAMESGTK